MAITLQPMHDRVLVRLLNQRKTEAGLVIPDTYVDDNPKAQVIAVGQGTALADGKFRPSLFAPGDIVLLSGAGAEVQVGDEKQYLMHERDIMAKVIEDGNN